MGLRTVKLDVNECTCERCGHVWCPRVVQVAGAWENPVPVCCGKCKSPHWNVKKPSVIGFLYVIGNVEAGRYKIGVSTDVPKRLNALQIGSPLPLTLIGQKAVDDMFGTELEIHKRLADARLHGEWFQLTKAQALALTK